MQQHTNCVLCLRKVTFLAALRNHVSQPENTFLFRAEGRQLVWVARVVSPAHAVSKDDLFVLNVRHQLCRLGTDVPLLLCT